MIKIQNQGFDHVEFVTRDAARVGSIFERQGFEKIGTRTLPAIEFVRKYSAERGTPGAQFEFICCLQGDHGAGCASFVEEAGFLLTLDMPGNDLLMK